MGLLIRRTSKACPVDVAQLCVDNLFRLMLSSKFWKAYSNIFGHNSSSVLHIILKVTDKLSSSIKPWKSWYNVTSHHFLPLRRELYPLSKLLSILHRIQGQEKLYRLRALGKFLLILSIVLWILSWITLHNRHWFSLDNFKLLVKRLAIPYLLLTLTTQNMVTVLFSCEFRKSDRVFLEKKRDTWKKALKLESPWIGPFKVLEKQPPVTHFLDFPSTIQIHPVIDVGHLKPYHADMSP